MLEKETGSSTNTLNLQDEKGTDAVFTSSVDNLLTSQSTEVTTYNNPQAIARAEENDYDILPPR